MPPSLGILQIPRSSQFLSAMSEKPSTDKNQAIQFQASQQAELELQPTLHHSLHYHPKDYDISRTCFEQSVLLMWYCSFGQPGIPVRLLWQSSSPQFLLQERVYHVFLTGHGHVSLECELPSTCTLARITNLLWVACF